MCVRSWRWIRWNLSSQHSTIGPAILVTLLKRTSEVFLECCCCLLSTGQSSRLTLKNYYTLVKSRPDSNISARRVCHGSLPKRIVVCNPVWLLLDWSGGGAVVYWHSFRSMYFSNMSRNMLSEFVGEVGEESRNRGMQSYSLELPVNTWKAMVGGWL